MLKDELKSRVDLCFNQVTMTLFRRVYGPEWYTRELAPYMRNIRRYSGDEKLIGEYERFISHNNDFSNADTTICAKILLFDERFDYLVGHAEDKKLLRHLLYLRNECSHSVQDISKDMYQDGLNSIAKANQIFLGNVMKSNSQTSKQSGENPVDNAVKRYYDGVREKVRKVTAWIVRILFVFSLVGTLWGCVFVFVHIEEGFKWWLDNVWRMYPWCCLAYAWLYVLWGLDELRKEKKYINCTSAGTIVVLNIVRMVRACIKNFLIALGVLLLCGLGVMSVKLLEGRSGFVINSSFFTTNIKAWIICIILNYINIKWILVILRDFCRRSLYRKIQKKPTLIFKCPGCKIKIRVPNGVKKILISCPNCRKDFIRRRGWKNFFFMKYEK